MDAEDVDWRGFDGVMKGIFFILRACWGLDRKKQDARLGVEGVENDGTRESFGRRVCVERRMIRFERW